MPEGPEIRTMSDQLRSKILNLTCSHMIMLPKSRYWKAPFFSSCQIQYQDNENHRVYNISSNVVQVLSRGKKIIIELKTLNDTLFRMVSSCAMYGRWSWNQSKYTCLILVFDTFCAFYDDVTNEGLFSICSYPSSEYEHIFKNVGPDLMTEEVTYEIYKRVITNPRIKNLKIMNFMMEQKYLSGIGNYLRAEILYKCRINPYRILGSFNENEIYMLFYYSKTTIWESYQSSGLTIQDYLDLTGNKGVYNCVCYGRESDNNGFKIIKEDDGKQRKITWCPQLQF